MREATLKDMDSIMEMSARFGKESNMPVNLDDARESIKGYIESENSVVFISEKGMAAAQLGPLFFNKSIMVAQEIFWWIDKEYRNKGVGQEFLMALENWAKDRGAKALIMIALMSSNPEKAVSMYIKNNYLPFEQSFIKYL